MKTNNTPTTMNANENTITDFENYCKDYIKDHISDYVGNAYYMCDLGCEITDAPNCDGTLTYSRALAKDYIREWWNEAAEYWNYEKLNFGENIHNPFDSPETYMVCMVIEGVRSLLSQCTEVNEQWDEKVELTQDLADSICEQIDGFNVEW